MKTLKYIFIINLLLLISCSKNDDTLKFVVATKKGTKYYLLNEIVNQLNKNGINSEIIVIDETNGKSAIDYLQSKEVDFAILENDFSPDSIMNLNSVLPLYPSIVMLLYMDNEVINDLDTLIRGNRVSMYLKEHEKTTYAQNMLKEFSILEKDYFPIYNTADNNLIDDSTKICFYLTGYDNSKVVKMIKNGAKIFSFDDFNLAYKGSSVDAFCIKHIYSYPFIIPKNMFGNYPDDPILTIAVDAVLVAREGIPNDVVYEITKMIVEQKGVLGQKNNIFGFVTEKFNAEKLKFPIHEGAKDYFERNEPTFLEKYIDVIGFAFTIILTFFGGIKSFLVWNKLRKKNRIDEYYKIVLATLDNLNNINHIDLLEIELKNLIELRKKAFSELINEKLTANESFRIFTELLDNTLQDIRLKIYKNN